MNKYYAVLGLSPGASKEEVRRKYRRLVLQWHPDKNPSPEAQSKFIAITEAYDILMGERPAPRVYSSGSMSYTRAARPKTEAEKRQEKRNMREQQMRTNFENIRRQHLNAPDHQQIKNRYYRKVRLYFALTGTIFILGFILPLTILDIASIIVTLPLSVGLGMRFLWTGGRIKMRADMIYGMRNNYSAADIAEFFRTRSGAYHHFSEITGE